MRRERPQGTCHICGADGPLSFEHIPPRKAFNEHRVVSVRFEEAINLGPDEFPRGKIHQRGVGGYTLCATCNNKTGHWYGNQFIDWCYEGMSVLMSSGGHPSLSYVVHLYPLPVLKEIVTMLFSVNHDRFHGVNQELVRFVLNRNRIGLPKKYRFFTYFNTSPQFRAMPITGLMQFERGGQPILISEFSYPPYGYVMTIDSEPPDDRLFEITHFARYEYYELAELALDLPVLPVHTPFPGDYRTKEEINKQIQQNKEFDAKNDKT